MPLSFAALQVYDQYLTNYRSHRKSKYEIHDTKTLKKIYSTIQWNGRFCPEYLSTPSPDDIRNAILLKEQACSFKNDLSSIKEETLQKLFTKKIPYSSNPDLVSVAYHQNEMTNSPASFRIRINRFATPQKNIGSYLTDNQEVMLPDGIYSFDLHVNQKNYELQFHIDQNMTHKMLQEKVIRLINHSDLGISASLLADPLNSSRNAILLTSTAVGQTRENANYFDISDEHTSQESGIVTYLGLNREIIPPENMIYEMDENTFTSCTNELDFFDSYHLIFHPENTVYRQLDQQITIGVYPDLESVTHNIQTYVNSYNRFMNTMVENKSIRGLFHDIKKMTALYHTQLADYGIQIESDYKLTFRQIDPITFQNNTSDSLSHLQQYGTNIEKKVDEIILDPMKYLNRRICSYKNPGLRCINPYETSIYTGLLFQSYI